jgi:hypothetical protein
MSDRHDLDYDEYAGWLQPFRALSLTKRQNNILIELERLDTTSPPIRKPIFSIITDLHPAFMKQTYRFWELMDEFKNIDPDSEDVKKAPKLLLRAICEVERFSEYQMIYGLIRPPREPVPTSAARQTLCCFKPIC